ncbi:hypothetical protein [Natrinema caseinilyticum]|uniref:hypothetical protein n=1 Tax=Natrinema caseinilyticum TaxID=2961570 RepID=UPI0020C533FE|nr:hypothetical protein [Natrinema caseinilyticum]
MPSLEGLKTWFDYELLLTKLAIIFLAVIWGINQIAGYLASLPFTSPKFALTFTATGLGTILVLLSLAGRL